jgi:hypothetical protein
MTQKIKRFKQGSGVSGGSKPLQNLDYNLVQGGSGRGVGGGGLQVRPTIMRQPSSDLSRLTGTSPPKGVGVQGTVRFKKGGSVSSASKRADGCATQGKTKGRFV